MKVVFRIESPTDDKIDFPVEMEYFPIIGDIVLLDGISYTVRARYVFVNDAHTDYMRSTQVQYMATITANN